jgi:hypothetical protein
MYEIRKHNGDTGTTNDCMTAQAESRLTKNPPAKKVAESAGAKGETKNALYAVEEHSLSGFLENEPDLYTVADIKVRYQ